MRIENFILWNLTENEDYVRSVLPFLKSEYFSEKPDQIVFDLIDNYITTYNKPPSKEALLIELSDIKGIKEEHYSKAQGIILSLACEKVPELEWSQKQTEKFCKEKAIHNALLEAISIADDSKRSNGEIPQILENALSVSFDTNIGHDFLVDWETRFDLYHTNENRVSFSLDLLNEISDGGVPNKTLTVILAGTGVGKSRLMCNEAAHNLMCGKNVLYITMEMADWRIAQRIDANLLDVDINQLKTVSKEDFEKKIKKLKTTGKLVVKEYPSGSGNVLTFKHLLNELRLKKNFKPDIIYIDYINICASSRLKRGNTNSYEYIKAIAEELRSLGQEFNLPVVTATQTNRTGFVSSDIGLQDTAESFGLPATADLMFALVSTDQLVELNQQMVIQLKNRLNDPFKNKRFVIGIDPLKMRYYNVDPSAQEDLIDKPLMDKTDFGGRMEEERFDKKKFEGFK